MTIVQVYKYKRWRIRGSSKHADMYTESSSGWLYILSVSIFLDKGFRLLLVDLPKTNILKRSMSSNYKKETNIFLSSVLIVLNYM